MLKSTIYVDPGGISLDNTVPGIDSLKGFILVGINSNMIDRASSRFNKHEVTRHKFILYNWRTHVTVQTVCGIILIESQDIKLLQCPYYQSRTVKALFTYPFVCIDGSRCIIKFVMDFSECFILELSSTCVMVCPWEPYTYQHPILLFTVSKNFSTMFHIFAI